MELKHVRSGLQSQDLKRIATVVRTLQGEGLSEREVYRLALAGDPDLTAEAWADQRAAALEAKLDPYFPDKSLVGFEAIGFAEAHNRVLLAHRHLTTDDNKRRVSVEEARTLARSPLYTVFVYVRAADCE